MNLHCFLELKKMNSSDIKYNWILQLKSLFESFNLGTEFGMLHGQFLSENITKLVAVATQFSNNEDVKSMLENNTLKHYRILKTHANQSKIYQANCRWDAIKLTQQIRFGFPIIKILGQNIQLNGINKWRNLKSSQKCRECDKSPEDNFHILAECNTLQSARNK